ncbi:hypothetical protein DSLASN_48190 [Desulfoluna limicola]|uniref:Diguanylate cyclase n=1 Tax=Desulfoluna limicola TaxID=2810562 RepID=A0ABN6FC74_9BACT|nr:EAL domain-containing protein [Desulfoluna limicola]BCS99187.1 hypothetical protein DSLASN_48190 [Desulfoluna limicola]
MGIRLKTILSIFIAVAISTGLFYRVADHAINTRFTALEEQQARSRMHTVLRFLESGRDGLQLLTNDWSLWNDAYSFINDGNPTFIESNLVEETFADTGLAYIGFFPQKGNAVWQGYYDHSTETMALPPNDFSRTLDRLVQSLRVRGAGAETQPGYFVSQGTFHFIAASPILKSDGSGPARGWLIMVQQLEKSFFNELLAQSSIKVTVATRPAPGEPGAILVHFTDNRKRYSCAGTVHDILEHPTIEITLTGPSEIYLAGRRLLTLTGFGIILTGLLLGLLTYVLIQRTLLKRIMALSSQVAPVSRPNAPVENVLPRGNDELSKLAVDINGVFKRIIEEECLNRSILTSLNVGVLMIDGQSGKILNTNTCMEEMVGKKAEALVGQPADPLFHPLPEDEQNQYAPHQEKGILQGNPPRQVVRTKTATRYHESPIRIETFTDIMALEAAMEDAKRSESHYRTLFKNSATPSVLFCKNGNIAKLNSEFLRYAGAKAPKELLGRHWSHFVDTEDEAKLQAYLAEKKNSVISFDDNVEVKFHDLMGGIHTAKVHMTRLPGTEEHIVSMLDITRQKKAEGMLRHQAFYDSLTGLANRRLFMETLDHSMNLARRRQRSLTLLLIDLDGFKHVNDTLGHQSGDLLLTMVAKRFTDTLRKSDTIARLGGDEFTILVEECYSAQELVLLLQRIQGAFEPPFEIGMTQLHITLSIGVARFPDDATDGETLIRNADLAMYRAKKTGNAYNFFTHRLDKEARLRFEMEQDLRKAMDETQFALYLQPRIGLEGNQLLGMEGLIRWCHPVKGICSPSEFIPCAEMNGLIVPMDLWVLRTGCRLTAEWNEKRETPLLISLNISAWHFRDNHLPERVARVLEETGCAPQWLELEITETALMENLAAAAPHLQKLRSMGVSIALDDFGTGYSSLNYLRKIPVDTLKIDRSFIATLTPEDPKGLFLVKTIVDLGKTFDIQVVAEGVEEPEQMRLLQSIGCPVAQGFLWSPPMAPADFPHHLDVFPPEKK